MSAAPAPAIAVVNGRRFLVGRERTREDRGFPDAPWALYVEVRCANTRAFLTRVFQMPDGTFRTWRDSPSFSTFEEALAHGLSEVAL